MSLSPTVPLPSPVYNFLLFPPLYCSFMLKPSYSSAHPSTHPLSSTSLSIDHGDSYIQSHILFFFPGFSLFFCDRLQVLYNFFLFSVSLFGNKNWSLNIAWSTAAIILPLCPGVIVFPAGSREKANILKITQPENTFYSNNFNSTKLKFTFKLENTFQISFQWVWLNKVKNLQLLNSLRKIPTLF